MREKSAECLQKAIPMSARIGLKVLNKLIYLFLPVIETQSSGLQSFDVLIAIEIPDVPWVPKGKKL